MSKAKAITLGTLIVAVFGFVTMSRWAPLRKPETPGYSRLMDPALMEKVVAAARKAAPEQAALRASHLRAAYVSNFLCEGKNVYFFSDIDIETTGSELDAGSMRNAGSGGYSVRVFREEGSELRSIWNEVLIDLVGFEQGSPCPKILVVLHGNHFGRAGNLYGLGKLAYMNGRYQVMESTDGKAVEFGSDHVVK